MSRALMILASLFLLLAQSTYAADPWADSVVSYDSGSNPEPGFTTAASAIGPPTADSTAYGGYVVSPFSAPSGEDELVSIGAGGHLTVMFDEPVFDDGRNLYGIDLLVFGNSFFGTSDFNFDQNTTVTGVTREGGVISISEDGVDFVPVTGVDADGLFPTNGYADSTDFFPTQPGNVPANFTRPVNPALDPTGLGAAALIAAYAGSGGGAGIDIGAYGLSQISYVRVTNPAGSILAPEIDAFADVSPVPEPTGLWLAVAGVLFLRRRQGVGRNKHVTT